MEWIILCNPDDYDVDGPLITCQLSTIDKVQT